MKSKIILVTGGSSGIGRSLVAKLYMDNTVIVCGRNPVNLNSCREEFQGIETIVADISSKSDIEKMYSLILKKYDKIDVLINNAGVANFADLTKTEDVLDSPDMGINFNGTVNLTTYLLPLIKKSSDPIIAIVSSILAKVPVYELPIYSASKAALHSYCVSLRVQLKDIPVVEVLPPLVDTAMTATVASNDKMSPDTVADLIIKGILQKKKEVYPGIAGTANVMSRIFPKKIAQIINHN